MKNLLIISQVKTNKNKAPNCADMSHIYGHTQLRAFIQSTNLYTQFFPRR